ncbi:MAG: RsmB/NOP family class I SAM-dependent RNA methyltransferase, partial [Gammaproteobacteria bacterium]
PWGLRLHKRLPMTLPALRDGRLEPQDEGSQLLAQVVRARPGARVLDACAGAGGKTLALAAMMQDRGELVAEDHDPARLKRLGPRAERAGLRCLRRAGGGLFDAVLVDAPCSGSGRLRRNPEARLHRPDLEALHAQQLAILTAAAARVKPGGQLVYATCSFSARENHEVVNAFLASDPAFTREDLRQRAGWAALALDGPDLQLWPHRHQTDGFYAASLLRQG